MNSTSYVPAVIGPMPTVKDPLPWMSVVTTPSSTVAIVLVTPCRVIDPQVPPPPSTGNWPKVAGNVVHKAVIVTWYSLLGVAPTKVKVTDNLCVVEFTDQLILLLV